MKLILATYVTAILWFMRDFVSVKSIFVIFSIFCQFVQIFQNCRFRFLNLSLLINICIIHTVAAMITMRPNYIQLRDVILNYSRDLFDQSITSFGVCGS